MFDEAALIIMEGLRTGFVEADGKFFKQPCEVRPRPHNFGKDRCVMVSHVPRRRRSRRNMAEAMRFSQGDWTHALPEIDAYRDTFLRVQRREGPNS